MKEKKKLWEELESKVSDKMDNRTDVLNPFRLDALKYIYLVALDAQEWAAYKFLQSREVFRGVFSTTTTTTTKFEMDGLKVQFRFPITSDWRNSDFPDVDTDWELIHPKARQYIMQWVRRNSELHNDEAEVRGHLNWVTRHCNTWGQAARIWPQLVSFYPREMRSKFLNRRASSSLPEGSWDFDPETDEPFLREECKPSYYDRAQELVSEAMLLPQYTREQFGDRPSISFDR